eukprot:GFYU01000929.1.p2 GENE.GFYU01000929.1~~GFYU01000929.1.p2  ORF type:complete len:160 (+),score=51.17 GFYU01000929.1:35-481(+)
MFWWLIVSSLSLVCGFIYPAYCSFKALQTDTAKDDQQLLIYWIVFGVINVVEFWTMLNLWFPFYAEIKLVATLWLLQLNGATVLWDAYLEPWLDAHEKVIDEKLDGVDDYLKDKASDAAGAIKDQVAGAVKDIVNEGVNSAMSTDKTK